MGNGFCTPFNNFIWSTSRDAISTGSDFEETFDHKILEAAKSSKNSVQKGTSVYSSSP